MSRTTDYLQRKGVCFQTIPHEKTFISVDEATAVGVTPHVVAKTILLDTKWGRALAVIPGDRRLDLRLAQDVVGDHRVRLASEEEIARDYPDLELGCLPPLGTLLGLPTYVDGGVMRHEEVVFAVCQTEALRARTLDLFDHEHVTVTRLAGERIGLDV